MEGAKGVEGGDGVIIVYGSVKVYRGGPGGPEDVGSGSGRWLLRRYVGVLLCFSRMVAGMRQAGLGVVGGVLEEGADP